MERAEYLVGTFGVGGNEYERKPEAADAAFAGVVRCGVHMTTMVVPLAISIIVIALLGWDEIFWLGAIVWGVAATILSAHLVAVGNSQGNLREDPLLDAGVERPVEVLGTSPDGAVPLELLIALGRYGNAFHPSYFGTYKEGNELERNRI